MHEKGRDIRRGDAADARGLADGCRTDASELFARLHAKRRDGGVIEVVWDGFAEFARFALDLNLLTLDKARVFNANLHSFGFPPGERGFDVAVAVFLEERIRHLRTTEELLKSVALAGSSAGNFQGTLAKLIFHVQASVLQANHFVVHGVALLLKFGPTLVGDETDFSTERRETHVGVVGTEYQSIFASRGEHAVGLAQILGAQVVDERAEVGAFARENELLGAVARPTLRQLRGVDASQ